MRNSDTDHYDAIIIGSGMGGLTCASLLAQLDRNKVLVLERHFTLNGYTHSFTRKNETKGNKGDAIRFSSWSAR